MQTILNNLTAAALRRAADLKDQITALQNELDGILTGDVSKPAEARPPKRRRRMSAEARAKISLAAKRRWKNAKLEGRKNL